MMSDREIFHLSIVVEINDDGYLARSPGIQGAFAEGDTIEEAIFNCVDVVKMIAAYRAERTTSPLGGLNVNPIKLPLSSQLLLTIPMGAV